MMPRRLYRALTGLALALIAGSALLLADVRRAGDPETASEIVVVVPEPVATAGAAPAPEDVSRSPVTTMAPMIRIPDHVRTFRAFATVVDGSASRLWYRAAVEARDAGHYATAADAFQQVAVAGSPLAPVAALRAAQMLGLAGEVEVAAEAFVAVVEADALPGPLRPVALMDGAAALVEAGRRAEALALLEMAEPLPGVSASMRAGARWQRTVILREDGDAAWYDLAVATMEADPTSPAARDALDTIEEAGITPPGMLAATVEYRGFRSAAAEARFQALLASGLLDDAERAAAWFYIGAIAERFGNRDGALEAYANALAADATSHLADDARYWRGRVLEELDRAAAATVEYDLLLRDYPGSNFAADAALRAGVAAGLAGDVDSALERLAALAGGGGPAGAEAARWHGLFREQAGRADVEPISAAGIDPTSYAAVLERSAPAAVSPFPASAFAETAGPVTLPGPARTEIEAWLAATFGPRERPAVAVLEEPLVTLALELARAGEPGVAGDLLFTTLNVRRGQPYELLDLAFVAHDAGLYDVAMVAALRVVGPLSPARRLQAPLPLLMLLYPAPYAAEAQAAADEFGVPPLLLLALVRQESAFNPRAGSHAGALGLTQVIEPTAAAIARVLGETWSFGRLVDPATALRFGAFYLAEQLATFDGHMLAALAAYNGGPGNAARWLEIAPFPGADGYILGVDFVETRSYLETVTENYAMYRFIYADAPVPMLP